MSGGARADEAELRRRLAEAGIAAPHNEAVVIDLAGDPPLGRSAGAIAVEEADRVVDGLGAAMVAARAKQGAIAVRDVAAQQAIARALEAREARSATVARVPDAWPSVGVDRDVGLEGAWVLDGERLLDLEAAALGRTRAPRRVTIAGAVARPGVQRLEAPLAVGELVARAGGPAADVGPAWVALDGGAWGGRAIDREEPPRSSLVLVLPAEHALVARARTPVVDHLRRVASACEGCRLCTDACPVALDGTPLAPHEIVAAVAQGLDAGTRPAAAIACAGCGLCDAACPSGLSPHAMVGAVRARLPDGIAAPPRGEPHPDRAARRMSIELLLLRAGLG